jgi:reactive intermediate/imine deaminase
MARGKLPFSPWVRAGDFIFVSGQTGFDPETGAIGDSIEEQTRQALANIEHLLKEAGGRMDQIVKTTVFLSDIKLFNRMNEAYLAFFSGRLPARSTIQAALANPKMLVEIEAVAYLGR